MTSGGMWAEGDELLSTEDPFFFLFHANFLIYKEKEKKKERKEMKKNPEVCSVNEIASD